WRAGLGRGWAGCSGVGSELLALVAGFGVAPAASLLGRRGPATCPQRTALCWCLTVGGSVRRGVRVPRERGSPFSLEEWVCRRDARGGAVGIRTRVTRRRAGARLSAPKEVPRWRPLHIRGPSTVPRHRSPCAGTPTVKSQ